MGAAQRTRGAYVNVQIAQAAGDISGMELETHADGNGITIEYVSLDQADSYVMTIDAASVFDQAVAVITPLCVFGIGTLETIIREGQDSAGAIVGAGAWVFNSSAAASDSFGTVAFMNGKVYVPPAKFVTIRRIVVNTPADITVGFSENIV